MTDPKTSTATNPLLVAQNRRWETIAFIGGVVTLISYAFGEILLTVVPPLLAVVRHECPGAVPPRLHLPPGQLVVGVMLVLPKMYGQKIGANLILNLLQTIRTWITKKPEPPSE